MTPASYIRLQRIIDLREESEQRAAAIQCLVNAPLAIIGLLLIWHPITCAMILPGLIAWWGYLKIACTYVAPKSRSRWWLHSLIWNALLLACSGAATGFGTANAALLIPMAYQGAHLWASWWGWKSANRVQEAQAYMDNQDPMQ